MLNHRNGIGTRTAPLSLLELLPTLSGAPLRCLELQPTTLTASLSILEPLPTALTAPLNLLEPLHRWQDTTSKGLRTLVGGGGRHL